MFDTYDKCYNKSFIASIIFLATMATAIVTYKSIPPTGSPFEIIPIVLTLVSSASLLTVIILDITCQQMSLSIESEVLKDLENLINKGEYNISFGYILNVKTSRPSKIYETCDEIKVIYENGTNEIFKASDINIIDTMKIDTPVLSKYTATSEDGEEWLSKTVIVLSATGKDITTGRELCERV